MKRLFYLLLVFGLFACSSDSDDDNNTDPVDDTNPVYLDSNGVTIKARDWALVGDSGVINGISYTIVDWATLTNMIQNGDDLTRVCTSRIIHMDDLFANMGSFNQPIGNWDVSNVTNMEYMFYKAHSFNQDIGTWDVSQVTTMGGMFSNSTFNQDISNWDTSSLVIISAMFNSADSFNQDIGDWNVSNVTNMNNMFRCTYFNQNLYSWDVSNVTSCEYFCCNNCGGGTEGAWTQPQPNFTNCN